MLRVSASATLSFLFFLSFHFAYFHFGAPREKVASLLLIAALGLAVFAALLCIVPSEEWFKGKLHISERAMNRWIFPAFGALFYAFLFLGYLEFYFTADRSITFRMLMIADKQPNHSVTQEQMASLYDVPGILKRRFDDLTYGGYLEQTGNVYRITDKAHIVLTIYRTAIEVLRFDTGEKEEGAGQIGRK